MRSTSPINLLHYEGLDWIGSVGWNLVLGHPPHSLDRVSDVSILSTASLLHPSLKTKMRSSSRRLGAVRGSLLNTVASRSYSLYKAPAPARTFPAPSLLPPLNSFDSFTQAIGNTSLIKLRGPSEVTGCNILAKCEWENPVSNQSCTWNGTSFKSDLQFNTDQFEVPALFLVLCYCLGW